MRAPTALLPAAGAVLAVAATGVPVALDGREPDVVNLAAGLVLLVAGAQLMALRQTKATGSLLVLASVAWFVPDLAGDAPVVGPMLAAASLVHVVALVAALLVAPLGSLVRRVDKAVVLGAAVAAGSAVTGGYQVLVPTVGLALLAAVVMTGQPVGGRPTRAVWSHRFAVVSTAMALTVVPIARAMVGPGHEESLFTAYSLLLALSAVALVRVGPWLRPSAALDVGPDALLALDDLLAEVTDDPRAHALVRIGEDLWVRLDGSPGVPPQMTAEPVVVVARRPVGPGLEALVAEGLRLAGDNVVGRRLVDDRVRELAALRGRLVRVEDDERAALVGRLRLGPLATLVDLRATLTVHDSSPDLLQRVRDTERDLERVASGLDPLDGFASSADAVRALGVQMGAAVDVDADVRVDATAGRALWFACSEILTNSAKHAPGAVRRVRLAADGSRVVMVVTDEGPGPGAARDAGLLGVRDRVAAVGGTITVTDVHPGTRVEVCVPTTRQHLPGTGAAADVRGSALSLTSTQPRPEANP